MDIPELGDWLIALVLGALPALAVAWLVRRRSWSAITRMIAGDAFGLALARMMQGPLVGFTPLGSQPGFLALLFNCALIAAGILVGLFLWEHRYALDAPAAPGANS